MAPNRPARPSDKTRRAAAIGASWISLVAATTLGAAGVGQVRARISGAGEELQAENEEYRLIVQSYSRSSLLDGAVPDAYAKPRASLQRAVTAEELQTGVDVKILQVLDGEVADDDVVVAWLERGKPDLEFDALEARPGKGAYYGAAASDADAGVRIVLRRQA